jgi:hypothetical protein
MSEWLWLQCRYAEQKRQYEDATHDRVFPSFLEWLVHQLPAPPPSE